MKVHEPEQFFLHTHKTALNTRFTTNAPDKYNVWLSGIKTTTNKNQGYGVAIILEANLAKYAYEIKEFKGFALAITLSFKGKYKVQIISVYNPLQTQSNILVKEKLRT